MATIKAYTDLEQSKKLAEILPLESADICYVCGNITLVSPTKYGDTSIEELYKKHIIPCWSLAALISILPILERKGYQKAKPRLLYDVVINKFVVDSHVYTTDAYDNPVDACIEMVIKLHEMNLL